MANKSDHYQHKIIEVSVEPHKLNNFPNDKSIEQHVSNMLYDDEILQLRQELLEEVYNIINDGSLTMHQKKVLTMYFEGSTQNEIADKVGCSQSAVHKCLSGNIDYRNGDKKRYGGVIKKLQKLSRNNPKIRIILEKIEKHKQISIIE